MDYPLTLLIYSGSYVSRPVYTHGSFSPKNGVRTTRDQDHETKLVNKVKGLIGQRRLYPKVSVFYRRQKDVEGLVLIRSKQNKINQ